MRTWFEHANMKITHVIEHMLSNTHDLTSTKIWSPIVSNILLVTRVSRIPGPEIFIISNVQRQTLAPKNVATLCFFMSF